MHNNAPSASPLSEAFAHMDTTLQYLAARLGPSLKKLSCPPDSADDGIESDDNSSDPAHEDACESSPSPSSASPPSTEPSSEPSPPESARSRP